MNHDALVATIAELFPGLSIIPPPGARVPKHQTSFWVPGLSRDDGRVVRIKSNGKLKKAATARLLRSGAGDSEDMRFEGTVDDLRTLVRGEIELVREATKDLDAPFPLSLESASSEPFFSVDLKNAVASQRQQSIARTAGATNASPNRDWTDDELSATVDCYREMLALAAGDIPFVKAAYYRKLSERFERVPGAFERRMQNISHLLAARGLCVLSGLKPQQNIGANVKPRLEKLLVPLFDEFEIASGYADELVEPSKVVEGAKKQVIVNAYERDPTAKQRCISIWGTVCVICSFDFGAAYGELGNGFIHVHHLRPMHTIGESYELDPENDLRPVCPNCHSMLHRRKIALSIQELSDQLKWRFVAP